MELNLNSRGGKYSLIVDEFYDQGASLAGSGASKNSRVLQYILLIFYLMILKASRYSRVDEQSGIQKKKNQWLPVRQPTVTRCTVTHTSNFRMII
jgi:hypothetical protein